MAEKEKEDHLGKHKRLYGHAQKILDTTAQLHMEALGTAYKKHLQDEKGYIDLRQLDDAKKQADVVETMKGIYVSRAKQQLKVGKDLNEMEEDMLMRVVGGTTSSELKQYFGKYGSKATHQQYMKASQQFQEKLQNDLYASAGHHFRQEHIPGIVKHIGLEGKVDPSKINLMEAQNLLLAFHDEGTVSDSALRQFVPSYKLKKEKDKEKMKKAA